MPTNNLTLCLIESLYRRKLIWEMETNCHIVYPRNAFLHPRCSGNKKSAAKGLFMKSATQYFGGLCCRYCGVVAGGYTAAWPP